MLCCIIVPEGTYLNRNMHKFIACAQSPLGKECLDFNDAINFPYRRLRRCELYPPCGISGLVVANDAFPISVKANVINTETMYNAVLITAPFSGLYDFISSSRHLLLDILEVEAVASDALLDRPLYVNA